MSFSSRLLNPSYSKENKEFKKKIKSILGVYPKNLAIYKEAFTHSSSALTKPNGDPLNYERLEFLGDSVIDLVVSSFLFEFAPQQNEGYLTDMRSKIVNRKSLNRLGKKLQLNQMLISNLSVVQMNQNVLGNTVESFVGAVYLDYGYATCKSFVVKHMIQPMGSIQSLENKIISYKSFLIEWCQKNKHPFLFQTSVEDSEEKNLGFHSIFYLNSKMTSEGEGLSKKEAEENASENGCLKLGIHPKRN